MSEAQLAQFIAHQPLTFLHAATPEAGRSEVCRANTPLNCHGSCFVNELPDAQLQYLREHLNRTAAAAPGRPAT